MKIVTAVVNNPIFIQIQHHTLHKYLKGSEYEFIVFNDAKEFIDFTNGGDITIKSQIKKVCEELNIKCINIPNDHHKQYKDPANRCADSMNYILKYQLSNPDKYLLLDSDMFLISDLDVTKYFNYDCAVVLQSRDNFKINYIWNGIYYFDINKLKNKELLNWNCCNMCDVGGMMSEWLTKQFNGTPIPNTDHIRHYDIEYHTNNIYIIRHLWSLTWNITELPLQLKTNDKLIQFLKNNVRNKGDKIYCEIYDNVFLHYRAGGNWNGEGMELHKRLSKELLDILVN